MCVPLTEMSVLSSYPVLAPVLAQVGILDLNSMKKPIYEALITSILGQKIWYTQAKANRSKLYAKVGHDFTVEDIEKQDLLGMGIEPLQVEIIRRVNVYLLDRYKGVIPVGYEEKAVKDLINVPGIGEWTINTTLLVWNPETDVFPIGDLFLRERVKRLFNLPRKPTLSQMKKITEVWSPHRGLITWHLWRWF